MRRLKKVVVILQPTVVQPPPEEPLLFQGEILQAEEPLLFQDEEPEPLNIPVVETDNIGNEWLYIAMAIVLLLAVLAVVIR